MVLARALAKVKSAHEFGFGTAWRSDLLFIVSSLDGLPSKIGRNSVLGKEPKLAKIVSRPKDQ